VALLGNIVRGLRKFQPGKLIKSAGATIAGGGLAGGALSTGKAILSRIGRKNLKRAAVGGAIVGGTVLAAHEAMQGGAAQGRSYRRMNPCNARALRRAFRRVEAGARMFAKYYRFKHGTIRGAHGVRARSIKRRSAA
jgi:hypothetical protein